MANIIASWRRMVNDTSSTTWTDDQAQSIIDRHSTRYHSRVVKPLPTYESGSYVYKEYHIGIGHVEEPVNNDVTRFRLFDSAGTNITTGFSFDWQNGRITFTSDQEGENYSIDFYSYDLNAAAADGWNEKAAAAAARFSFSADGASFSRSDEYKAYESMARLYGSRSSTFVSDVDRPGVV